MFLRMAIHSNFPNMKPNPAHQLDLPGPGPGVIFALTLNVTRTQRSCPVYRAASSENPNLALCLFFRVL